MLWLEHIATVISHELMGSLHFGIFCIWLMSCMSNIFYWASILDVIIEICFKSLKQIDIKWLFLLYNGYVYIDVFSLHIDYCYPLHRCNYDYQVYVMGRVPYVGWVVVVPLWWSVCLFSNKKKGHHNFQNCNSDPPQTQLHNYTITQRS
jgi:hypothetical protein